ncbi:GyrI-like small molecule binding domain protein [Candidatus Tiddalikarchaeum anstoanum]|nr:GyrI-like small molecule binding domain protein [Candidatus Tiddalikarchaeum anstoanum]
MASKTDFKKENKDLFSSKKTPSTVMVPELNYLMIDGAGYPGESKEYTDSISALYPIAYNLKFMSKLELKKDYVVPPLEGLWWADDMDDFTKGNRNKWKWTIMIMQPNWITNEMLRKAASKVEEKSPALKNIISKIRLNKYKEGKSAQVLYIGPYKEETLTIQKLHEFIKEQNGSFNGQKQKHHEVYLSDPRKVKPEKLKTIIRQPFT